MDSSMFCSAPVIVLPSANVIQANGFGTFRTCYLFQQLSGEICMGMKERALKNYIAVLIKRFYLSI
jgi:hypothetical protein